MVSLLRHKAALDSYIDQLRDAIQGTKASNAGGAGAGKSMMKMIPAPGGQSKFGTYSVILLFFLSFLVCDVSVSLLSVYGSLLAFSDTI